VEVIYGTSSFLNFSEAFLTSEVAKYHNAQGIFFYYPRGKTWEEKDLYEIYRPLPPPNIAEEIAYYQNVLGLKAMSLLELVSNLPTDVQNMTVEEIAESIKKCRRIKYFIVYWLNPTTPVRIGKDKNWKNGKERKMPLIEAVKNQELKLGGSMLYHVTALFVRSDPNRRFIIPTREKDDVLNALTAASLSQDRVIHTGMLDIMTEEQRGEKGFRVAPFDRIDPIRNEIEPIIISRVIEKRENCRIIIGAAGRWSFEIF
jgi:hypothetical protein